MQGYFDCHVLGRPPCHKSASPTKILTRFVFYSLGFVKALGTYIQSLWNDGQIYTRLDREIERISPEKKIMHYQKNSC